MKRVVEIGLAALAASLAVMSAATADEVTPSAQTDMQDVRGQSVMDRPRPGYDAAGIHAGSFMVYPKADVSESYNDNIYATDSSTKSDFITMVSPSVAVNSLWSRHALNFGGGIDKFWYADNTGENRLDWHVSADGRLDILRDTNIVASAAYAQLHEDRALPTSASSTAEPTKYKLFMSSIAFNHAFNRVTTSLAGSWNRYNYDDVPLIGGGILDQDFRDRDEYTESAKLGYLLSPDTNVYLRGTLNQRKYDDQPPVVAVTRDSKGYQVVVGSDFKLSRLMEGGVYVGYQHQTYDEPSFSDDSGVAYGANVNWFVTPLTTVRLNADSTIEESVIGGNSSYLAQSVGLGLDHELLRNVIISGDVGYENDDFKGISRKDDIYSGALGVKYLLNPNFALGLEYRIIDRSSNIGTNDYTRNVVGLTLRGQL